MLLWFMIIILTAVVVAVIARPLLGEHADDVDLGSPDAGRLNVYRDQLAELERDLARNVIGEAEAATAKLELSRRLLAHSGTADTSLKPTAQGIPPFAQVAVAAAIPVIAIGLYLLHGVPGLPGRPNLAQPQVASTISTPGAPDVSELMAQVESRLRDAPEDGRGWDVIAPVYLRDQRFADARAAYARAIRLLGESPKRLLGFAESSVRAADGRVTDEARAAYEKITLVEPERIEPRFWLAVAREQRGELPEAAEAYRALLQIAPADAPWRNTVIERLAAIVPEAPPNARGTQPTRGPSADEAAAASSMTVEARQQMIGSMVDGLHARLKINGQDVAGWLRLLRSYAVLGDIAKANAALVEARRALSNDTTGLSAVDMLARDIGLGS